MSSKSINQNHGILCQEMSKRETLSKCHPHTADSTNPHEIALGNMIEYKHEQKSNQRARRWRCEISLEGQEILTLLIKPIHPNPITSVLIKIYTILYKQRAKQQQKGKAVTTNKSPARIL
jgi:hypothetical protein